MFAELEPREHQPTKEDGSYLAVYGTLGVGNDNHWVIQELLDRNHARLQYKRAYLGGMCLVNINGLPAVYSVHPWLRRDMEIWRVECTVYRVTRETFHVLDAFEGHPHFYSRQQSPIYQIIDGVKRNQVAAYVYHGPYPGHGYCESDKPFGSMMYKVSDDNKLWVGSWDKRNDDDTESVPCIYRGGHVTIIGTPNERRLPRRALRYENVVPPAPLPQDRMAELMRRAEFEVLNREQAADFRAVDIAQREAVEEQIDADELVDAEIEWDMEVEDEAN